MENLKIIWKIGDVNENKGFMHIPCLNFSKKETKIHNRVGANSSFDNRNNHYT